MRKKITGKVTLDGPVELNKTLIVEGTVTQPEEVKAKILALFQRPEVKFILAHNAKKGCFSCRITRD
ncbi:DUF1203 domain-containing protein [Rouxiella badensis]|uniref:DUF1203 domain-containing protein n=1 Tax=Rouxiella badensis TaxID=1646377 RepID=UPI0036F34A4D